MSVSLSDGDSVLTKSPSKVILFTLELSLSNSPSWFACLIRHWGLFFAEAP